MSNNQKAKKCKDCAFREGVLCTITLPIYKRKIENQYKSYKQTHYACSFHTTDPSEMLEHKKMFTQRVIKSRHEAKRICKQCVDRE